MVKKCTQKMVNLECVIKKGIKNIYILIYIYYLKGVFLKWQ